VPNLEKKTSSSIGVDTVFNDNFKCTNMVLYEMANDSKMESGISEAAVAYFKTLRYHIPGKKKGNQL
jgi:hypothetical protein